MNNENKLYYPLRSKKQTSTSHDSYEVIENEKLTDCNLSGLVISGALFSLTLFKNVTFRSCDFFASRIENCEFINCKFENCTFQFSGIEYCDFHSTIFENCTWDVSHIKRSLLSLCDLDPKTEFFVKKDKNNKLLGNPVREVPIGDQFWKKAA